ncbi:MAG: response regulator [Propionivibrio sp.]
MSIFGQIRSILGRGVTPGSDAPGLIDRVERRSRRRISTHRGRRILIVDDSPTIVAALRKMLQSAGCATFEALDAGAGLELARQQRPDLIFLDIVLPGMNGFTALRVLRREPTTQAIPVIMISGNEQATEQFYVKRIGADDFMKKPFSRFELFARIDSLVDLGKLARLEPGGTVEERREKPATAPPETTAASNAASPPPEEAGDRAQTAPAIPHAPLRISADEIVQLEARKQLHDMGLQYYNQEQFAAAIARGDKLALELFIAGKGIAIDA